MLKQLSKMTKVNVMPADHQYIKIDTLNILVCSRLAHNTAVLLTFYGSKD